MTDALRTFKTDLFKALGHPTRLRILEILRTSECTVSELQAQLAIEASAVSQQLAVLRARNLVETRKAGTNVYYRVRDPRVFQLMDIGRDLFVSHLAGMQASLDASDLEAIANRSEPVGAGR